MATLRETLENSRRTLLQTQKIAPSDALNRALASVNKNLATLASNEAQPKPVVSQQPVQPVATFTPSQPTPQAQTPSQQNVQITSGENLTIIAEREGVTIEAILEANKNNDAIVDRNTIIAGKTIIIPTREDVVSTKPIIDSATFKLPAGVSNATTQSLAELKNIDAKAFGFAQFSPEALATRRSEVEKRIIDAIKPIVGDIGDGIDSDALDLGLEAKDVDLPDKESDISLEALSQTLLAKLEAVKKALSDFVDKERTRLDKEKSDLETKISGLEKEQKDILTEDVKPLLDPFREQLEKTERQRLKVEENFFKNQNSVDELDGLLTNIQEEIKLEKARTGLSSIRSPRISKLQQDAIARVGVIEAVMKARDGQISTAEGLIDRSVNAIEADRQDQLTYYEAVLGLIADKKDTAGNRLVTATASDKGFVKLQIDRLQSEIDTSQESVDLIKSMMIDPATADMLEQSGVKLTDTLPEIQGKLSKYTYNQEQAIIKNQMVDDGFEFVPTQALLDIKPGGVIAKKIDSRGKEHLFWRPKTADEKETEGIADDVGLSGERGVLRKAILDLNATLQRESFGAVGTINNGSDILDLLDSQTLKLGPAAGREQTIKQAFGETSKEFDRFLTLATLFTANFMKAISGATVPEDEVKRLSRALPDVNKPMEVNRTNIEEIANTLENQFELIIGVDFEDFPEAIPLPRNRAAVAIPSAEEGLEAALEAQIKEEEGGQQSLIGFDTLFK